MRSKFKVAGLIAVGALAGALTTIQIGAYARNSQSALPLEELQQLATVFGTHQLPAVTLSAARSTMLITSNL